MKNNKIKYLESNIAEIKNKMANLLSIMINELERKHTLNVDEKKI